MAKKAEVIITCDGTQVKRVLEEIDRRVKELTANRQALNQKIQQGIQLTKAEEKQDKAWEQEIKALTSAQKKNQAEYQRLRDIMNDLANAKAKDLKRALRDLQKMLNEVSASSPRRAEVIRKNMEKVQKKIEDVTGETGKFGQTHNAVWRTAVRNITAYMGVFSTFNFIKDKMTGMVRDNLSLSDSMAQVQKVTGLTSEEVKLLNNNLSKMDTRSTITQLNELAYSAGKMGLGKYGVEGIMGFVNATNQLQVALGDDLGSSVDEAITPLAKLAENLGLIQNMGVEKSMMAIGSSINELSQTTTAAGKNIVDFARRIQPSAQMIGLTTDQILALGSATDSFGVASEISATAFTKFLSAYRTNTAEIERILGITKGTLDKFFDEGRAIDGLLTIFQRMHEIGDLRYLEEAFKALGSEGSRMFVTFGAFAKNIDAFREHLATSTKAFEEATSVTREYNLVQETAQGIIERTSNIWRNAFVNPEGVDAVKQLADEWYRLSKELTGSETWMASAKTSLGLILEAVKMLIEVLPTLIRLMMFYGVGVVLQGIVNNFNSIYRAVMLAGNGVQRFNLLLKTNALAIAVTLLGYVVSKFIDMKTAANSATDAVNRNQEALQRSQRVADTYNNAMSSSYANLMDKYDKLKREWKSLKTEQEKNKWIKDNKKEFDELGISVTNAYTAEDAFEKNTARVVDGFKRRAEAAALAAQMTELYRQQMEIETEAGERLKKYGKSAGDKAVNQSGSFTRDDNGTTFNNGQFTLGSNGAYYYTEKGALEYNRQVLKQLQQEYDQIGKRIDESAKRMEELGKKPVVSGTVHANEKDNKKNTKAPEWMKDEKEEAEKKTRAVIASIEEFYRLQEAAANELAANGQLEGKDFEMLIKHIQDRKDQMLLEARRAIVGDKNTWDTIKTELEGDLVKRDSEVSREAIKRIQEAEPAKQGAALRKYNGSDEVFGLDSNAYLNSIRKNAAQNELNIQRRQAAIQTEIDKILIQYQYVEQAQRKFGDKLVTLGLITDGYDKVVKQLADGTEIVANTKDVQALADKTVRMDTKKFFGVDPDDALELRNMIDDLMHTVDKDGNRIRESFASMFPDLDAWMEAPEQYKEQMQAFYTALIDMDSDYYKALKQNYEQEKREFSERWQAMGWESQERQENTAFETQDSLRKISGQGESFGQTYGFVDEIADDPEIARIKNRMEWRARELEDLQARNASEELIMEKQNEMLKEAAALAEKVSSEVAERIGKIQTLSEPLNAWGEEVGQMLGEMWQGISRDGKLTFGQMAKNMGIEYAKLTLKMMSENLTKKLQQALFYKTFEAQAMAHQSTLTAIEVSGGAARIAAESATNTALDTMESIHNSARVAKEAQVAAIMAMFGVSEGAAKTIATLGFWGIPLIGVITAVLMGLLSSAQSTANQESSKANAATPKVKLASGMLTYDEGNVKRFIGQDGKVYTATEEAQPRDGLVTHPIATTVQGQPALVAENGPEIVVGRKTTQAIMMNEPELIKYLANYDRYGGRGYRPYDSGNLDTVQGEGLMVNGQSSMFNGQLSPDDARALTAAINAFIAQCQKPLQAQINKYGTGGLIEEVKSGMKFMAKYQ